MARILHVIFSSMHFQNTRQNLLTVTRKMIRWRKTSVGRTIIYSNRGDLTLDLIRRVRQTDQSKQKSRDNNFLTSTIVMSDQRSQGPSYIVVICPRTREKHISSMKRPTGFGIPRRSRKTYSGSGRALLYRGLIRASILRITNRAMGY